MNKNEQLYNQIEPFLLGQLSPAEAGIFQDAIHKDHRLMEEVELRRLEFDVSEELIARQTRFLFKKWKVKSPENKLSANGRKNGSPPWTGIFLVIIGVLVTTFLLTREWSTPAAQQDPNGMLIADTVRNEVPAVEEMENEWPGPVLSPEEPPDEGGLPLPADIPVADRNMNSDSPLIADINPPILPEQTQILIEKSSPATPVPAAVALANQYYILPDFEAYEIAEASTQGKEADFGIAIKAFQDQDYKKVKTILGEQESLSPDGMYLLGHTCYQLGEYTAAADYLELAAADHSYNYADEAAWYNLLSRVALDKTTDEAFKRSLYKVSNNKRHPYRIAASGLVRQLNVTWMEDEEEFKPPVTLTLEDCIDYVIIQDTITEISTKIITVVTRGSYEYRIKLEEEKGQWKAIIFSVGGEKLVMGDEIFLLNKYKNRRGFIITGAGSTDENVSTCSFPLDRSDLIWMGSDYIESIYLKNNVKMQMTKFSINIDRQKALSNLLNCFIKAIKD